MHTINQNVASLLRSVSAALLIKKESRFRIVAYDKAADAIEQMAQDIKALWKEGKLDDVPGVGESIRAHLDEYFKTGKVKHFEHTFKGIPAATFTLMHVPGIGPIRAYKLATTFHLENPKTAVRDLKKVAEEGKIAELESFGSKSQTLIMESLDRFIASEQSPSRMLMPYAAELADRVIAHLKKHKSVGTCDVLGSLRRGVPTIGDIDIACIVPEDQIAAVIKHFTEFPGLLKVDNAGGKKASIILPPRIRVDLRLESDNGYGAMLQYFTGSKAHNIKLREYAIGKGYSLSEWGIKKVEDRGPLAKGDEHKIMRFNTEEAFYGFLKMKVPPPELREGTNEIELALKDNLPNLIKLTDIKGDLHVHSDYDLKPSHDRGAHTFQEMSDRARALKYEYIGFSEHNPKQSGHTASQIVDIMKRRQEYIHKHVKGLPYFIGLEVDILPSGEIALPEKAIDYVDYLIVSVHSSFTQSKEQMTKRVKTALLYPKVRIFGHPTGRLLMKREGIDLNWDVIFDICKKRDIALEVNSSADRLDLPDTLVREGLKNGLRFAIDTDSHALEHMDTMKYGVSVARRGWCEKKDIVNALPLASLKKWIHAV
ncbi:hypothetical protein HYS00_00205 [Candidatus Microgenomates bacterium]|nr:hypothetical protein [Candidatus Microgenomates bacterium]